MTDAYVFDTEALIAYLYQESGYQYVGGLLGDVGKGKADGFLATLNAGEVLYLVSRIEGTDDDKPTAQSLRIADRDVRAFGRRGIAIRRANWRLAGEIKADGHISLADAYAVALAHDLDATLVVGDDDDFDSLPVDIDVEQFRN